MATIKLIIPTGVNLVAHINDTLVLSRKRGFDGVIDLPPMRVRAKAAVHENGLLKVVEQLDNAPVGEFTP